MSKTHTHLFNLPPLLRVFVTTYAFALHGQFNPNPALHYNPHRNPDLGYSPTGRRCLSILRSCISHPQMVNHSGFCHRTINLYPPICKSMPAPRYYSATFPSPRPSPQAIRYPTIMALSAVFCSKIMALYMFRLCRRHLRYAW